MAEFAEENRSVRLTSPFGGEVMLRNLVGEETLSGLFRFRLDLYSEDPDLVADDIVGKPLSVEIDLDGAGELEPRWMSGIVSRFAFSSTQDEGYSYTAELVPWTWLLSRSGGPRIFQELSALEVVRAVLDESSGADFECAVPADASEPRPYCVQYRETDLEFVQRLLEQEGYFTFFTHASDRHTLVITSADRQGADCPELGAAVRYMGTKDAPAKPGLSVTQWVHERALHPNAVTLADYNYEDPRTRLLVTREAALELPVGGDTDLYEYPGEFDKLGPKDGAKLDFADEWVRLRMLEEEAAAVRVHGKSACHLLTPGHRFEIVNHGRASENDMYLITNVKHRLVQPVGPEAAPAGSVYENTFTCQPASVPFVPRRRTPRPRIHGPQTAVVVGDEGTDPGDVRIDEKGRIKVQFHWDRAETDDGETTCWLRVSEGWAGAGWGGVFHPRVGHEVVVSFLEGDPDRPLITGRVYNGVNEMPYPEPTQGGIKSRSTPGGSAENFNEIRLEDKKDEEEIHVQAERDLTLYIKRDETRTIDHDRKEKIGNDASIEIGNDRKEEIKRDATRAITRDQTLTVGRDKTETVDGDASLTVAKSRTISIGKDATLTVDKDASVTIAKGAETSVGDALTVEAKSVTVKAQDSITLEVGSAKITLDKTGAITVKGSDVKLEGSMGVTLKGAKVAVN